MKKVVAFFISLSVLLFLAGILFGIEVGKRSERKLMASRDGAVATPTMSTLPTSMQETRISPTPVGWNGNEPASAGNVNLPTAGQEAPEDPTQGPSSAPEDPIGSADDPAQELTPTPEDGDPGDTLTAAPDLTPTLTPTPTNTPTPTPKPTKAPSPTGGAVSGTGYYGKLKVVGHSLTDASGKPVQLRGMSTHGLAWFPDYVNKELFTQLKGWGANLIRLAMYTAEYGGYCSGGNKDNLKKLIDNGVKYATELNMYVIIDWHILSDSNPNTNKAEALKFFGEMSKKYAGNDHVIYEICNEPNGGTSWADIKKYAGEVIPVIRKNAKDAVIIVGTPTWSQEVDKAAADPITGYDNIMYALHFYAATHKKDLQNKCENAYNKGLPIFVTEFGICDASGNGSLDKTEANRWIALLDKLGISYANWSLCNKAESASFISSGCSKKSGLTYNELSESGKWVVDMLSKGGANTASITPGAGNISATPTPTQKPKATPTPSLSPTPTPSPTPTATPTPTPSPSPTPVPIEIEKAFGPVKGMNVNVENSGNTYEDNEGYTVFTISVEITNDSDTDETNWKRKLEFKPDYEIKLVNSWWQAKAEKKGNGIEITPTAEQYMTVPANGKLDGAFTMMIGVKRKEKAAEKPGDKPKAP